MRNLYRAASAFITIFFCTATLGSVWASAAETGAETASGVQEQEDIPLWEQERYYRYQQSHSQSSQGTDHLTLTAQHITARSGDTELLDSYENKEGSLVRTGEGSSVTFSFEVKTEGLYQLLFSYYPVDGAGAPIVRSLYLDGELPFYEAAELSFGRVWADEGDSYYHVDSTGNQLSAVQKEEKRWLSQYALDQTGVISEPLSFYLSAGTHTLTLVAVSEPMVLEKMEWLAPQTPQTYAQYIEECRRTYGEGSRPTETIRLQAENMHERSESMLTGSVDRGADAVPPCTSDLSVINYLDGGKFKSPNDWVSYRFEVKESGFYKLAFKFRQGYKNGGVSFRRLYLNGKVPFEEALSAPFAYSEDWTVMTIGGDTPYYLYLEEGEEYVLTLEATAGDISETISRCQLIADELNRIYRALFSITGPDPDMFRDYEFDKLVPEELQLLEENGEKLRQLIQEFKESTGEQGVSYFSPVERLAVDIEKMVADPDSIAQRLNNFVTNIGSFTEWMLELQSQPLDLDWIEILPQDVQPSAAKTGFFQTCWHYIRQFLYSFTSAYRTVPAEDQESIKVWLGTTGRDQANIIRQLIDESFTEESGIQVQLQFITGALLPSTLAGIGPDVYMFAALSEPVNYAMRGAVKGLSDFPGFSEVAARFSEQALIPYTYEGETYAIPETVQYPMLFYRKDVLDELQLEPPETWEETYDLLAELQSQNLGMAMLTDINGYYMFLYQNGGSVFGDSTQSVTFDSLNAISSFEQWTDFFTSYRLSTAYSFVNRFRTGEMPIGIADYTTANQLNVSAPEIRGLWGMTLVPGVRGEDGSINRSVPLSGTANIIMEQTTAPEAAWEFLKWWSSDSVQEEYNVRLENQLGVAGRHPTANQQAFSKQRWSKSDLQQLLLQQDSMVGIPEAPGSYIISRYVMFAFNAVVDEKAEPAKELLYYTPRINAELVRKHNEFSARTER
jgi:ABC transporter, substrate-binding protein